MTSPHGRPPTTRSSQRRAFSARVVMGAPHPVILYADDGEVLLINETWSAITGYQREDIPNIDTWVEKAHGDRKHTVTTGRRVPSPPMCLCVMSSRWYPVIADLRVVVAPRRRPHTGSLGGAPPTPPGRERSSLGWKSVVGGLPCGDVIEQKGGGGGSPDSSRSGRSRSSTSMRRPPLAYTAPALAIPLRRNPLGPCKRLPRLTAPVLYRRRRNGFSRISSSLHPGS